MANAKHTIWLVPVFLISAHVCHATLILTACAPDRVVLAADGLMLKPGGNPPSVQGCKIIQGADNCFFAISGEQDDASIKYDLVPMARSNCQRDGSIIQRANDFEKRALPEVRRAWNQVKAHQPEAYALMKKAGQARVSVVFASGPPFTVVIVQYVENALGDMVIDNSIVNTGNFVSQTSYQRVGASENVEVYQRQHPEIGYLDDVEFLRRLLIGTIQLEGNQKRIGPPIAILELSSDGAKWIEQGSCSRIIKANKAKKVTR
jgi:hypothetical protein